eukprot:6176498-Prymnesium_polylepis.1
MWTGGRREGETRARVWKQKSEHPEIAQNCKLQRGLLRSLQGAFRLVADVVAVESDCTSKRPSTLAINGWRIKGHHSRILRIFTVV